MIREQRPGSRQNRRSQGRGLSPIARLIILVPLALLLFAYARTWDVTQWGIAQLLALHTQAASKPALFEATAASEATYSRSWYVESAASSAMSDMQTLALHDARWTTKSQQCDGKHFASLVLLDFGEPHTSNGVYGTYTVNTNLFWSTSDIAAAAQDYLLTWREVSPLCRLKLALGLSNHHQCAFDGLACRIPVVGNLWADMVTSLNSWIRGQGYDQQLQVWGAYDAETTWDGADRTRQFVDGFTAHDSFQVPLVDFGDMRQGDPLIDPDTGQPEQRWTDADRYYMAWKAPYDVSLPEIYDPGDLGDWIRLQQNDHAMYFLGIMTEACTSEPALALTDPRVGCGATFNGYGFSPATAFLQLKQTMLQQAPLYYITSMPVPY